MTTNDYILMCMGRVKTMLYLSLKGLTLEQICQRPSPQANPIAWIAWHMTRGFDRRISLMDGNDQTWIYEKWYEKYSLPPFPDDLGIGHTSEQVNRVIPDDVEVVMGYYESVHNRMEGYLQTENSKNYDKILVGSENSQGYELMRMVAGTMQHVGQVNYVRGLIEDRIWYIGNLKEKR